MHEYFDVPAEARSPVERLGDDLQQVALLWTIA